MRAEDVVGSTFFLLVFIGIGLILVGSSQPTGTPARHRRQGAGLMTMALALLAFGALTSWFIRTSARPVIEGNLWAVANGGVRSRGSSFKMTAPSGDVATIHCLYDGPGLREGDRARVRYVAYNRRLLEFTGLSGPYTGWHFEEPAGERIAVAFAVIGLVCALAGGRLLAKARAEG
jgi:hypothetical protein